MAEFEPKSELSPYSQDSLKPPTLLEELRSVRWSDIKFLGSGLREIATLDWRSSTTLEKAVTIGLTVASAGVIARVIFP